MLKKIIAILAMSMSIGTVSAKDPLNLIIPWNAGSLTDTVIRQTAKAYERIHGKDLVVKNISGAQGVVGMNSWKNGPHSDVVVTTASTNVFNYVDKNIQVPYSESDFDHFIYLGTMPGLYITRPDTQIRTPADLRTKLPKSVGGYGSNWNSNLMVLIKDFKLESKIVEYKNTSQMVIDVANGTIDLAITAPSPTVMALVQEGKLHIVGTTYHEDITLNNSKITSVAKTLKIQQFNGFIGLAFHPKSLVEWNTQIKKDLWSAVNDPSVKETMVKFGMIYDPINDTEKIKNRLNDLRKKAAFYLE